MEATIIYPHQLFREHPALKRNRHVFLVEEPLLLTEFPIHRAKLMLHRVTLKAYEVRLKDAGYQVTYVDVREYATTQSVFELLKHHGVETLHIVDTTDDWLETRIHEACTEFGFKRVTYESPLFILTRQEACDRYIASKKHLAAFYKKMRQDKYVLLDGTGGPVGGEWSYDAHNQKRIPKGMSIPHDPVSRDGEDIREARAWIKAVSGEQYGDPIVWLPTTHEDADRYLESFIAERLIHFGPYEDAIDTEHMQLFHSALSPIMNIGLLTPHEVVDAALSHTHAIPIASLEGFIRQIIGWREFVRASYEVDGRRFRTQNFWGHTKRLTPQLWEGNTGLPPLDITINRAQIFGYTHHIERLMVMGNFMFLAQIHPDEVYRWFMALFIDAYDWVMVPNVYGMSQFSDAHTFATKPYISGSNYLKKMGNYKKGDWEELWDALYWNCIDTHRDFFMHNHRLSMMPRLFDRMSPDRQHALRKKAATYLASRDSDGGS